jgi:hypothetical protein
MQPPNARLMNGISNKNEANCDVNCFDESSIANCGGRPSGWQSASRLWKVPAAAGCGDWRPPKTSAFWGVAQLEQGHGWLFPRTDRSRVTAWFALLCVFACLPLPALGQGWDAVLADYLLTGQTPRPAVARVVAPDGSGTSLGSGVLVDTNALQALVLTNWHVVRDSRSPVLVQFPDGFQSAGTVLRVDPVWDLAAIVIWKPDVEPVSLADHAAAIGEPLTIAGYGRGPYREVSGGCTQYLSPGHGQPMELVELVADARQGDSGGPIFNAQGELAGVLFGESGGRTIGASSPRVRAFLAAVGSNGYSPQASLPSSLAAAALHPSIQTADDQTHLMMTASHRTGPTRDDRESQLPTLNVPSQQPPHDAAAFTAQPEPERNIVGRGAAEESALPIANERSAVSGDAGAADTQLPEPPPPPPLEFADLIAAARSFAPSGNPQNLLFVAGGGALILVGLRGISRVMG